MFLLDDTVGDASLQNARKHISTKQSAQNIVKPALAILWCFSRNTILSKDEERWLRSDYILSKQRDLHTPDISSLLYALSQRSPIRIRRLSTSATRFL